MKQKITLRHLPMGKEGYEAGDLIHNPKINIEQGGVYEVAKPNCVVGAYNQWQAQHLYATTDEDIKEGDWYIDFTDNSISNCFIDAVKEVTKCRKLIASTDPSLNLPSIPLHLKQAYATSNGLNNVWDMEMVEVYDSGGEDGIETWTDTPKLSGNEIVVSEKKTELIFKQPEDSNLKWVQDQHASGIIDKSFLEMGNPKQLNQPATDKAEAVAFAEWILKRRIIMTEVYEDGGFKDKWWLDKVAYTTEQLYSIFKQH